MARNRKGGASDRELGMDRPITRRDFVQGAAVGSAGLLAAAWLPGCGQREPSLPIAAQDRPGYYPPSLNGLRGSHPGSFESAHALRDGHALPKPVELDEQYDLIVVGAGISGLAAAHFYRTARPRREDPAARQPRRLRRPRQAQRVRARRPHGADERRHPADRQPAALQRRRRRRAQGDRHRRGGARAGDPDAGPGFLRIPRVHRHGPVLRPRDLRCRPPRGRFPPPPVARIPGRHAAVARGAARCRAHRIRQAGLHAGPDFDAEEAAADEDQLPRLPARYRAGRSAGAGAVPGADAGRVGSGNRRGLGARLLGRGPVRLRRTQAGARLDPRHGLHAGRLCRHRRIAAPAFPGRQRDHRPRPRASPDSGRRAGNHRRGPDHGARRLRAPRPSRRAGAPAAQQHGGARAQRRRAGGARAAPASPTCAMVARSPCARATACWPATT